MTRAVLVTGGAGYIGSHCCKALADAGFLPITYDDLSTGHANFVKWGPLIVGDIRDKSKVAQTLKSHEVAAVMHFAAASLVGESVTDPQKYYYHNVVGSVAVLDAMQEAGCDRIVFSSTGAVYGDAGSGLLSEQLRCQPVNPYGRSKFTVEQILSDYRSAYGMPSFSLRYFNASGAHATAGIGEWRATETHLIPRAMMALSGNLKEFSIYGDDYDTPDGTAIRDYIHVVDLAGAHLAALQLLLQGHKGGSYNLGTGNGFSVKEVLSAIAKVAGTQVPCTTRDRRPGDPAVLVADPSAARSVLNFKPEFSDLHTIISTAWTWHLAANVRGEVGELLAGTTLETTDLRKGEGRILG
jgi:UDP-glucose-4-epimerase GalE